MRPFFFGLHTAIVVILGTAIAMFLFKRRLIRRFPLFFCYIAYSTLDVLVRVGLLWWKGEMWYFAVYWYSEIGEVLLALLSIRESLFAMFQGFSRYKWFRWLVWTSAWMALGYGAWKAVAQPPQAGPWIMSLVVSTELLFQYWLMSIGVLFFLLVLALGIPLQQRECWIVFGFLAESLLIVSGFLLRSVFGKRFLTASIVLPSLAYIVGKSIWLAGVTRREEFFYASTSPQNIKAEEMFFVLDRQIATLKKLFRRLPRLSRRD